MARPIWKGQISFGLVNIPITLYSAEKRADLSFRLIDSRNESAIRYERINEETGEEVPWDKVVKGYEYSDGSYVLLKNEELERVSPKLTRTIEIEQFVALDAIDPIYFDRPYYLVPGKGGEKGYVLLREALEKSERVGVAQVVIRNRGRLAALSPRGDSLMLDLMRYHDEVRSAKDFDIPGASLREYKITRKELDLAERLIDGMSGDWDPSRYKDEYRKAVMDMIQKRIDSGQLKEVAEEAPAEAEEQPRTVNFMEMLKRSVEEKEPRKSHRRKTARRKSTRKTTRKKKAG